MKYFFYLLLLSIVFSFGMYIGIDRTDKQVVANNVEEETSTEETDEIDIVTREKIIEEIEKEGVVNREIEPSFLHSVAGKGEEIVKVMFDQIVDVTYAIVDGIF